MKNIENYVGVAKILRVFSSGYQYTCKYIKHILNFNKNF